MSSVIHVTANDFVKEVEQDQGKVLVDFYAEWCGPCKVIGPAIETIANENEDLKVVKVDADQASDIMIRYGIRGIPTLLLFNNGKVEGTKVGSLPLSELRNFVAQ